MRNSIKNGCAICGAVVKFVAASTEEQSCDQCGATLRAQMIFHAILLGLGYPLSVSGASISPDLSRVGLGISDDWKIATALARLFQYTNSYLHQFPTVDLLSPPQECFEYFEFISCSDVLEHTQPPRERPLRGMYNMLKPGGFVVISVPLRLGVDFKEFYPGLVDWEVRDNSVIWRDSESRSHQDDSPEFHGGQGLTLAFRQWTEETLIDDLKTIGFVEMTSIEVPIFPQSERSICVLIARKGTDLVG